MNSSWCILTKNSPKWHQCFLKYYIKWIVQEFKKRKKYFQHFDKIWRSGKKIVQVKKNQSIHFDLETLGVSTSEQSINFQTFLRADLLTHSWGKTQLNLKNTQKLQSQIKKNDSSLDIFFWKKSQQSTLTQQLFRHRIILNKRGKFHNFIVLFYTKKNNWNVRWGLFQV